MTTGKMSGLEDLNCGLKKEAVLNIVPRLYEELDRLTPALGRVAKYIIEHPEKVVQQSIGELGEFSGSGEASVVRLCHLMGYSGFRAFKVGLAEDLGRNSAPGLRRSPSLAGHVAALRQGVDTLLDSATRDLDAQAVEQTARWLAAATRIDIYGAGVSGIIAELFAYRLLRLRLTALAFRDAHMAHEVAHGLNQNCVAIAISDSGLTSETLRFIQTAKRGGARTIAITTRSKSPLVDISDIVLRVPPALRGSAIDAISSAPAKMLVLEAIAAALVAIMPAHPS